MSYLFQPSRAAQVTMREIRARTSATYQLNWGIPEVDDYLIPMLPGDLVTLVGRPGHGKTTALVHLAKHNMSLLRASGDEGVVVYATWETMIEEATIILSSEASGYTLEDVGRGKVDVLEMERAVAAFIGKNMVVVGRSISLSRTKSRNIGTQTLSDLVSCLDELVVANLPPRLLLVDYLQRIPSVGVDTQVRVSSNLEMLKDICIGFGIPSAVGVQARRDVDDYSGIRMPGLGDGQWSSNIEQTSDKEIALARPALYQQDGKRKSAKGIRKEERLYPILSTTICMKVNKQRWGRSGDIFVLEMDPYRSVLKEAEFAEEGSALF